MKIKKAFTLLEMLVVVGIIAILVSMGIASYSTAQRKARDAKRRSDMSSIRNAYEQYYSLCSFRYPTALPASGAKLTATTADCPQLSANVEILTMPADPLGYQYVCEGCTTSTFLICPSTSVGGGQRLETESCNDQSCCLANQQ